MLMNLRVSCISLKCFDVVEECLPVFDFLSYKNFQFHFRAYDESGCSFHFLMIEERMIERSGIGCYVLWLEEYSSSTKNGFFLQYLNLCVGISTYSQARGWKNHETGVSSPALPCRSYHIRLVQHSLAQVLLQLRFWPFQHVMEDDGHLGPRGLPLGEHRSFRFWWLDTPRPHDSRVDASKQSAANISLHILFQLCHEAD